MRNMACFPLFLELEDKNVLVVGGGRVGTEKALVLLQFGAAVRVVSKTMSAELQTAALGNPRLTLVCRAFCDEDIGEIALCIDATDSSAVNERVAALCTAKKIPVNVVDQVERCSFYFPAIVKRENIVCGISSGGKSPLVAQFLRRRITEAIPPFLPEINERMGSLRRIVKEKCGSQKKRAAVFRAVFERLIKSENALGEDEIQKIISDTGE